MTPSTDRLKHGIHNEQVCEYLELKKEVFSDWVITAAFYAALHFVSHKIFPFEVAAIEGKKTTIVNIEQYYNYINTRKKSKHDLLAELVDTKCDGLSADYDWLLDASMNARYHYYHVDKDIAGKAIRLMKAIKKGCVTDKEIAAL